MNKNFFLILILILIIFSCSFNEKNTSKKELQDNYDNSTDSLVSIKAYKGLSISDLTDNYYKLTFNKLLDITSALKFGKNEKLNASHILVTIADEVTGINDGIIILPESTETLETEIVDNIKSIFNDLHQTIGTKSKSTELLSDQNYDGKIQIKGYQVVGNSELISKASKTNSFFSIEKIRIRENELDSKTSDNSKGWYGGDVIGDFSPQQSYISVTNSSTSYNANTRRFYWSGTWTSQANLNLLYHGASPAFEPDIYLQTSWWLFGTTSWAKLDPNVNCYAAFSNMPESYIDTQAFDGDYKAFTIGSTQAQDFVLNVNYYSLLYIPPKDNTPRGLGHEIQHFDVSGAERDPWGVGIFPWDPKHEIKFFNDGDRSLPFSGYFSK